MRYGIINSVAQKSRAHSVGLLSLKNGISKGGKEGTDMWNGSGEIRSRLQPNLFTRIEKSRGRPDSANLGAGISLE
jgi:hypothetical protein